MSIPDTGSRIPDPTRTSKEEGKKLVAFPFLAATNFTKLKILLFFNRKRKKFEPIDTAL